MNMVRIAPTPMPGGPSKLCKPTMTEAVAARLSAIVGHTRYTGPGVRLNHRSRIPNSAAEPTTE